MAASSVAVLDSSSAAKSIGTLTDLAGVQRTQVSLDNAAQTYRASASFTPQATAAVNMFYLTGSATKTVRVKRLLLGGVSTANASVICQIVRTTALGAGGTLVVPTVAKMDSASAAATAVATHTTTSLKATGTGASGPLTTFRLYTSVVTTPTVTPVLFCVYPELGGQGGQSMVLRGASEFFEVQLVGGGNLSAGTVLDYMWEWEEDAS